MLFARRTNSFYNTEGEDPEGGSETETDEEAEK